MTNLKGFTLVEMLVVIGIIAILIAVMVPQVQKARDKAKEQATVAQVQSLELALENFQANHNGLYPGSAVDIMAPFPEYGLGDPQFVQGGSNTVAPPNLPQAGTIVVPRFSSGVLGGTVNLGSIKSVRDFGSATGPNNTPRWFDRLVLDGSITGYPPNQFKKGAGASVPMYNIFRYQGLVIDPQNFAASIQSFRPYILVENNRANALPITSDSGWVRYQGENSGSYFGQEYWRFGTNKLIDDDKFFSPGAFAYVPILTTTPFPIADDPNTPGNDAYKWGTLVSSYMIFGYGSRDNREDKYADERAKFLDEGLPGFGGRGVDTPYEDAVYNLFDGAIYFSRK